MHCFLYIEKKKPLKFSFMQNNASSSFTSKSYCCISQLAMHSNEMKGKLCLHYTFDPGCHKSFTCNQTQISTFSCAISQNICLKII